MDAATYFSVRAEDWQSREMSLLTPESCHVMPSGNRMPLLGLGTWHLNHHTVDSLCSALQMGYRMVDTSADYHTQRGIGDAIKSCGLERDSIYVITKVDPDQDGYAATRRNLAQLKLEYADLILMNRPAREATQETAWDGLRRAQREGLVHDIGVSSYSIDQIEELVYRTGEMPVVNQVEWSPFGHSPRMLDFCRDNGIVIQAWSPLTRATRLNEDK